MYRGYFHILGLVLVAHAATAQLGPGWIQHTNSGWLDPEVNREHVKVSPLPTQFSSTNNYCSYTNADGVEEFHIRNTHANRIEIRVLHDYQAPSPGRQFEGDVMVMPPTGDECVVQIFGNNTRATLFMLRSGDKDGGSLRYYTRQVLATNVYETWVHVNLIHMPGQFVQVYLNGDLKGQWPDDSEDHLHFFKYGCYGTMLTGHSCVKWKNVKFFTDGQPPKADEK